VRAWGSNWAGQCTVPNDLGSCTTIAAGHFFTVVVNKVGTVQVWGWNGERQCDLPLNLGTCTYIAAGPYRAAALSSVEYPPCLSDLNGDCSINGSDLGMLLAHWGSEPANAVSDINSDGNVDGADLGYLLNGWGPCPN
jgi:hypothetical protein